MPDFVEKAAQALHRKFAPGLPQLLLCGALDAGSADPYFKRLASNLRGRALQLLQPAAAASPEDQRPGDLSLFCMVGAAGLYAGAASPRACGGFFPGGTRYIRQEGGETISRAGAKVAEALHGLRLHREPPPPGAHWLELGAAPGGMTAELLAKGYRVTAVDRAAIDTRLDGAPGLVSVQCDVVRYRPRRDARFAAMLCDMNGDPRIAMRQVARLSAALEPGGLVVFTFKTAGAASPAAIRELAEDTLAEASPLRLIAETHLTYNRLEFTWLLELPRQTT